MQNLQRVRRYQRELEDAEGRADQAESSLHLIRVRFYTLLYLPCFIFSFTGQASQFGRNQQEQLAKGLRARGRDVSRHQPCT